MDTEPRTSPRLAPLPPDERDDRTDELLAAARVPPGAAGGPAPNIYTTLVRHPRLFKRWLAFGGALLTGELPPRDRELLVLRTAWRCRSAYEWGQHVLIATAVGLTTEEIDRVTLGPDAAEWEHFDATLLRSADELHDDSTIGDEVWAALAARYDDRQLIEVPMLVGHYRMLAGALNSLGVQPDDGIPPW